jgi:poly(glycerol-phosphate) alpha-glucosyltransferase
MGYLSAQQAHSGPQGKSATVIDTPLQSSLFQSTIHNPQSTIHNLPSVLFAGPAFGDAKDALLSSASAFILPSFSEGLPMSVLEAWAYQLPLLMTDHCNLPEGFANNAAIRIGTDVESIAEGMRLIVRSPISDLRSLGENGRQLVSERFTWPMVAAQMKEVYDWVLGGGAKPECVRQF